MILSDMIVSNAVIAIPAIAALILVFQPDYRRAAQINTIASGITFVFSLILLIKGKETNDYLFVDDLNIVFIVLSTFIGFTTSIFSASYIDFEIGKGKLNSNNIRFYHAMYQIMMLAMNLALLATNIGLMWVAVEIATLSTVLMVGIYRSSEALEAAWKYFILGSVGIALALFGTILVYTAAEPIIGEGYNSMVWQSLLEHADHFNP
ncbi:MAG: hydrogenase 4 subunit F, partial [Methylocystaceae bacterium]|nr:hydrogenase 4 subunit F [Methylocystaceae bacterium]